MNDTRKLKLCKVLPLPKGHEKDYPFKSGDVVLMLGEIDQMPGLCIVATKAGRAIMGFHMDNFRELEVDEV